MSRSPRISRPARQLGFAFASAKPPRPERCALCGAERGRAATTARAEKPPLCGPCRARLHDAGRRR